MSQAASFEVVEAEPARAWWAANVSTLVRPDAYVALLKRGGEPVCALAYDELNGRNVMAHVWAVSNGWASRDRLTEFLSLPFQAWNVERVTAKIESDNAAARRLVDGLGFVLEAVLPGAGRVGDLMFYRFGRAELSALRNRMDRKGYDYGKIEAAAGP